MDREMETRIGCSGWSYQGWVGPFYPKGTKPGDFLSLYSMVFDAVEIDSTFYAIPSADKVMKWRDSTPDDFVFTAKMPKIITHERRLVNCETHLSYFLDSIKLLGDKLGMLLIQFPHSFDFDRNHVTFRSFIGNLPDDTRFAVEFRNESWFVEETYSILRENGITIAWSETPFTGARDKLTGDGVYLRLVGDRTIDENRFGSVQIDRDREIHEWTNRIDSFRGKLDSAFIFTNNHFQGFGPATANNVRRQMGMEELDLSKLRASAGDDNQSSLLDW